MDGGQHQSGAAGRRAMSNPMVLEQIGTSLAAPDLSSLRQSCRDWNDSFVPEFRKKHKPIQLRSDSKVKEFTGLLRFFHGNVNGNQIPWPWPFSKYALGPSVQDLEHFIDLCGPSTSSLQLHLNPEGEEGAREKLIRNNIFKGAPHLRELVLTTQDQPPSFKYIDTDDSAQSTSDSEPLESSGSEEEDEGEAPTKKARTGPAPDEEEDIQEEEDGEAAPSPDLPNSHFVGPLPRLKKLKFSHYLRQPRQFQGLVHDLVASAEGLEELSLDWEHQLEDLDGDEFLVLLPLLSAIRDSVSARAKFAKLRSLSLARVRAADLQVLSQFGLQLEHFSTSVISRDLENATANGYGVNLTTWDGDVGHGGEDEPTASLFHAFLTSQAASLRRLELNTESYNVAPLRLPRLDRLHTFRLEDSGIHGAELTYDGGFAAAFPGLKSFWQLDDYDPRKSWQLEVTEAERQLAHPGVTQLVVQMTLDKFVQFGPLFPSVTSAQLYLDGRRSEQDVCARMWDIWPSLTSLLVDGYLTKLNWDELLVGVSADGAHRLRRELNAMEGQEQLAANMTKDKLGELVAKYKSRPSMVDLNQLRRLTLTLRGRQPGKLTDLAGYFGLSLALASPEMQALLIDGRVVNELSAGCSEHLSSLLRPYMTFRIEPTGSEFGVPPHHGDYDDYIMRID